MTIQRLPYSYRTDANVPAFPDDRAIIVFDGHCVLCSGWAKFILRYDRDQQFRLLAAQSPLGQALYRHYGLNPETFETLIVLKDGRAHFDSDAIFKVLAGLGVPWSLANAFRVIPPMLRDWVYRRIANNRYSLFGRSDSCFLPAPKDRERFLS